MEVRNGAAYACIENGTEEPVDDNEAALIARVLRRRTYGGDASVGRSFEP